MGDRMQFVTANTNEAPQSAASYKIQSIPALIYLINGKEVRRSEGSMTKADFIGEINTAFGGAPQGAAVVPGASPAGVGPAVKIIVGSLAAAAVVAGVGYWATK